MFEGSLQDVSKMFHGSFKGVLREIEGCSESPLRVIQQSLKVSKKSSKYVSRLFQRCFKGAPTLPRLTQPRLATTQNATTQTAFNPDCY